MKANTELRVHVLRRAEGQLQLGFRGPIDAHTYPGLVKQLESLLATLPRQLVLDLSALEHLSSSGALLVVNTCKRVAEAGGQAAIVRPRQDLYNVFELLGVAALMRFAATPEEAWASLP